MPAPVSANPPSRRISTGVISTTMTPPGFLGQNVSVEATSWDLFGYAGLKFGPFGVFGKIGNSWWDADAKLDSDIGRFSDNDSGNDPAYGLGARFQLWSVQFRAEYEVFDIADTDDVTMWSIGAAWTF